MNADGSCICPTSWFKSHTLWATEVWADHNHKIPLCPLAWPWLSLPGAFPVSFAFQVRFGASSTELRLRSTELIIGTPQTKTLQGAWGELCFLDPSLGLFPLGSQARFPVGINSSAWLCVTELPPKGATSVYAQEQPPRHSHVWLTTQTITVWHNPCICYFRGLVGGRWQRFRSQWSPSALQTRQDCWALFSFGSFPSISTLQVTPIGSSVSVSS